MMFFFFLFKIYFHLNIVTFMKLDCKSMLTELNVSFLWLMWSKANELMLTFRRLKEQH